MPFVLGGPITATAQIAQDDLIVGARSITSPRLLRVDAQFRVTTLPSEAQDRLHFGILANRQNNSALLLDSDLVLTAGRITLLDGVGRTTTITNFNGGIIDGFWLPDGSLIYTDGKRSVGTFDASFTTQSTLFRLSSQLVRAIAPGPHNGIYVSAGAQVLDVSLSGSVRRTMYRGPLQLTRIRYDYGGAQIIGVRSSAILAIDEASTRARTIVDLPGFPVADFKLTENRALIAVGGQSVVEVRVIDVVTGATLRTIPLGSVGTPQSIERYGSNQLHVTRLPALRQLIFEMVNPSVASKPYVLAISSAASPRLRFGNRYLALKIDPLVVLSIQGNIAGLVNNVGVLDSMGRATAVFRNRGIPSVPINLYAAWVSYDRTGILSVSETELFVLP